MPPPQSLSDSIFQTPAPLNDRKRGYTPASAFNFRSHKKRRMSVADSSTESPSGSGPLFQFQNTSASSVDRFIPLRPSSVVPLTISPRTNRMYKSFGLLSSKRLAYKDENTPPGNTSQRPEGTALSLLRKNASNLFTSLKLANGCSVAQNLAKAPHPTLILDSPGLTTSLYSKPLSWSVANQIAVACSQHVYYQDLNTKVVSLFFTAGAHDYPTSEAVSIAWGDEKHGLKLGCINDTGRWEIFEVGSKDALLVDPKPWADPDNVDTKCLSWNGDLLAFGMSSGDIEFYDIRFRKQSFHVGGPAEGSGHRKTVVSLAWDCTGNYLASGDVEGNVHIWDVRTQKSLTEAKRNSKIRQQAAIKALAWCPWKPDLLATGSYYPEGIIKIWSGTKLSSGPVEPESTLSLNAAVHSLVWSPHCKELLSIHGVQFEPESNKNHHRRTLSYITSASDLPAADTLLAEPRTKKIKPTIIPGPLTHSILVHDYPSGKRLFTLSRAHRHSITAACLGPSGQDVFTASPKEQTIKMWKVWGTPAKRAKENPFESCIIR